MDALSKENTRGRVLRAQIEAQLSHIYIFPIYQLSCLYIIGVYPVFILVALNTRRLIRLDV